MSVHFLHEVERLKKRILSLGAAVEENVRDAVEAIERRDAVLAAQVVAGDDDVDRAEVDIEEECLKLLALYQPVAVDLRYIVAILKINNDLERISDLAVNIAQRAQYLGERAPVPFPFDLRRMADHAQQMLGQCLDALIEQNEAAARAVCAADAEVDAMNRAAYTRVLEALRRDPANAEQILCVFSVARQLERIADHATNIAEDVLYMLRGEIVRHQAEAKGSFPAERVAAAHPGGG
mgnify:CR=1 FL=1